MTIKTALIGYSGFVGGNLKEQYNFTNLYNSKNFQQMQGLDYDMVVCAGVSAVKWMANKQPEIDLKNINVLQEVLATIQTKQFILISTIAVYSVTQGQNEDSDCDCLENHAYGAHRLQFEKFCSNIFNNCVIVRLPGLFGKGLKKNVIYDLLNDNCLEMINVNSTHQYYCLDQLWSDITTAIENNIKLINLVGEPITIQEIVDKFFSEKQVGQKPMPEGHYDFQSKYGKYWNNKIYIYNKQQIIQQLSDFIYNYKVKEKSL